jgi:hypothetical protein
VLESVSLPFANLLRSYVIKRPYFVNPFSGDLTRSKVFIVYLFNATMQESIAYLRREMTSMHIKPAQE